MTSLYEAATNGMNHDRFLDGATTSGSTMSDDLFGDSTFLKMKQHFWTAKQLFRSKLGKKEDKHLLASDAELDMKITRFFSVYETTRRLLSIIENYHHFSEEIVDIEYDLADFLKIEAGGEKAHLEKVMRITASCLEVTAKQRRRTFRPLVALYHDLDVFNDRAIADCQATVEAAERARVEYRGSLLWIKSASEELDPASSAQMEKFRTAQTVVRQKKDKFDALKSDTLQKVDVLAKSRTVLLMDLAKQLHDSVRMFYENSAKVFDQITEQLDGIESYEIDVLKILNDPVGLALKRQRETGKQKKINNCRKSDVELEEIEVGQIVMDIPRLKPAPSRRSFKTGKQNTVGSIIKLDDNDVGNIINELPTSEILLAAQTPSSLESSTERNTPFRIDSPLGIFEQDKQELTLNSEFAVMKNKSVENFLTNEDKTQTDLLMLLDENTFEANKESIQRIQPPPSTANLQDMQVKETKTHLSENQLSLINDDLNFLTIDLNDNGPPSSIDNIQSNKSPTKLQRGSGRPSPSTNLSSFLADELEIALNFSKMSKNSSQQM